MTGHVSREAGQEWPLAQLGPTLLPVPSKSLKGGDSVPCPRLELDINALPLAPELPGYSASLRSGPCVPPGPKDLHLLSMPCAGSPRAGGSASLGLSLPYLCSEWLAQVLKA